ncbi:MAG: L-rhamnose isomerase, partial [Enterococcus sp.]|nr:L-rhamnose isomerase [Enterococcus sp.]
MSREIEKTYKLARNKYKNELGIDTEEAIKALSQKAISVHCWQGDDVLGFDQKDATLTGGIQTTGNYPGKARNFEELTADFEKAMSMVGGKKRINLHASYAIFDDEHPRVDRDQLEYCHFEPWVAWAKEKGFGIDFNPTYFVHPKMNNDCSISSSDEDTRQFWVRHGIACRKISEQIGKELNDKVLCNQWCPDGLKEIPADRLGPRLRLKKSLNEIFAEKLPHVIDAVESKVFGIGLESYTVGSNEFYMAYAASHDGVYNLIDNGHYHPTENAADKIATNLAYFDYVPLHVTRPVRWDSDHVVLYDDTTQEIAEEIVRNDSGMEKVLIGLDFFDASINRIACWVTGTRAMQKALLRALLKPNAKLKGMQDNFEFSEKLILNEQSKFMPIDAVWNEFCRREGVAQESELWSIIKDYESNILLSRK